MFWWIPPPKWGRMLYLLLDTSSHEGEDVIPSDELGVVVGDFISGIVILGFCDGIVLGFFGGGHVVVIGVL